MLICSKRSKQFFWTLLLLCGFLLARDTLAIEYGGVGGRPAYPRSDNPRTDSIFVHTLEPGQVQQEGVLLVNNTEEVKTLLVYAVDSVVSSGGAFACRQKSEPQEGVGAWVLLGEEEVTLASGGNKIIPFTISVPPNASAGEQNGCIIIQEKKEKDPNQTGVSLSFRTGLRIAVTVPGELVRQLEIVGLTVEKNNGMVVYKPAVRNTGNVSIDTTVKVRTQHFLNLENSEHGGQYPILRGEVSDWNFELKNFFLGGFYKATLSVFYEAGNNIEIGKETGENILVIEGPSQWFFVPPTFWAFVIELLILVVIVFIIFSYWMFKKRARWVKDSWVSYNIKPNDDIKTLANRFDVSWKLLAKANKITAPYTLKTGAKIQVPPKK